MYIQELTGHHLLDNELVMAFLNVIFFTILGALFKFLLHPRLKKLVQRSKWSGDDIVVSSAESQIVFWFFLFGLSTAIDDINLTEESKSYINIVVSILFIASFTHALAKLIMAFVRRSPKNSKKPPNPDKPRRSIVVGSVTTTSVWVKVAHHTIS